MSEENETNTTEEKLASDDLLCREQLKSEPLIVESLEQEGNQAVIRFTNGKRIEFDSIPTGIYESLLHVTKLI